ncbi:GNAT family N-acetyltransferase [bacterium]|nr:GNAT family N-acetyltransferase [bacterium]
MQLPRRLDTERLVLRPFMEEDNAPFLAFMMDPIATRYLVFPDEMRTRPGAQALFDTVMGSYEGEAPIFSLAITERNGRFVGSCGLSPLGSDNGTWECYYSLLREFWGRGYASEATKALLEWAFQTSSIREIRAYMSPENPNSAGVAERIGMVDLGLQPHPVFGNEGRVFAMTRPNSQHPHPARTT